MAKINTVIVHEPWGFDKLFPYLKDAFRVLSEAYKIIYDERLGNPYTKPPDKKNGYPGEIKIYHLMLDYIKIIAAR